MEFPAIHLVEYAAALWTLNDVRCQAHHFVSTEKTKLGFPLKRGAIIQPAHPPSAVRPGFRIIRCETRPRDTSDGR
jgi:hypothetical protein